MENNESVGAHEAKAKQEMKIEIIPTPGKRNRSWAVAAFNGNYSYEVGIIKKVKVNNVETPAKEEYPYRAKVLGNTFKCINFQSAKISIFSMMFSFMNGMASFCADNKIRNAQDLGDICKNMEVCNGVG